MDTSTEKLVVSGLLGALVGYALHKSAAVGALVGVGSALVIDTYMASRGRGTAGTAQRVPRPPMRTLVSRRVLPAGVAARLSKTGAAVGPSPQYDLQYQRQAQAQQAQQQAPQYDQEGAAEAAASESDWASQVAREDQMAWVGREALDPIHRALWTVDYGTK